MTLARLPEAMLTPEEQAEDRRFAQAVPPLALWALLLILPSGRTTWVVLLALCFSHERLRLGRWQREIAILALLFGLSVILSLMVQALRTQGFSSGTVTLLVVFLRIIPLMIGLQRYGNVHGVVRAHLGSFGSRWLVTLGLAVLASIPLHVLQIQAFRAVLGSTGP